MTRPSPTSLAVVALLALLVRCAPAPPRPPLAVRAAPRAVTSAAVAPAPRVEASAAAVAPRAKRPPPPVVTAPMAGEPSAAERAAVRLRPSTCDDYAASSQDLVHAEIRRMREDLRAEYQAWAAEQLACWEEYRWRGQAYGIGDGASGSGVGHGMGSGGAALKSRAPVASRTNAQVAGVDEADLVKTDGRYLYLAVNGALRILQAFPPRVVSVTPLSGNVRELFLKDDRVVVYASIGRPSPRCTYAYDCEFAGDGSSTRIVVVDVSDRAAPTKLRELVTSGSLVAARRIGTTVHTVVVDNDAPRRAPSWDTWPAELPRCGVREAVVRARLAELERDNRRRILARGPSFPTLRDGLSERRLCEGLMRPVRDEGRAFTTLVSFDLSDASAPPVTSTVQSRPGAVFASTDSLYLAVRREARERRARSSASRASADETSVIHRFAIGDAPSRTRYAGSGVVPGHVLSQFSMDEWAGTLRVATTKGRVPDPNVESAVSLLARDPSGDLVRVGAVSGMARGEDIRAVRFDDDRAYVVTFKKTDPLFVLDLYDAAQPKILGELKIPGFSTYLHRLDQDHLLSIGFDANDHGGFAFFDGVLLQLFDVAEPTAPKLLFREKIGTRGSSSVAATDHLAFNYLPERGLLALPMTECAGGGDGTPGDEIAFSGLVVYRVGVDRGFSRLGGVDHGAAGVSCQTWWSRGASVVKRSLFVDDFVYSVATDRVKVQRLGQLGIDVADLALGR